MEAIDPLNVYLIHIIEHISCYLPAIEAAYVADLIYTLYNVKDKYKLVSTYKDTEVDIQEVIWIPKHSLRIHLDHLPSPQLVIGPAGDKGYGIFAKHTIPYNTRVLFYCGELITSEEAIQRYRHTYDDMKWNYILTIKEIIPPVDRASPSQTIVTNIDASHRGGIARYLNHSCNPNLKVIMNRQVDFTGHVTMYPNVSDEYNGISDMTRHLNSLIGLPMFLTKRTIRPGDELTFDYASNDHKDYISLTEATNAHKRAKVLNRTLCLGNDIDATIRTSSKRCHCGAYSCRKWLPSG